MPAPSEGSVSGLAADGAALSLFRFVSLGRKRLGLGCHIAASRAEHTAGLVKDRPQRVGPVNVRGCPRLGHTLLRRGASTVSGTGAATPRRGPCKAARPGWAHRASCANTWFSSALQEAGLFCDKLLADVGRATSPLPPDWPPSHARRRRPLPPTPPPHRHRSHGHRRRRAGLQSPPPAAL